MVSIQCPYEYILESHPQRLSQTRYTHFDPIRLRCLSVHILFMAGNHLSHTPQTCCGSPSSNTVSFAGSYNDHSTSGVFYPRGTSAFVNGDFEDTRLPGPYDQRTFTPLYGICIPCHVRYPLPSSHIHLPDPSHTRGNARMFRRIQGQPFWDPLCFSRNYNICHTKYLLKTVVQ